MRAYGLLVTALFALAVAAPAVGLIKQDSFPLSTYPMFSKKRERVRVTQVLGVDEHRRKSPLPPRVVADSDEVMLASTTVRRAVRAGRRAQKRLCQRIAKRVAEDAALAQIRRIEIATVSYDPIKYFLHGPEPLKQRTHRRCRVGRP